MMIRALWKGDISFGMVSIPIAVIPATENTDLHFHLLDSKDNSRVRYQRINENTGKEVPWSEIVKGYEVDKDQYIIMEEKELEKASPDLFKSIDIEEFVDLNEVDALYFDKPYYIIPASKNKKAYVLLREALKKTNKVGIAKVIIRTKEYLSLILPHEHSLILNLIHFKDEIRKEDELDLPDEQLKNYKITDRELKMAVSLIKDMTVKWKPDKYHNTYRETLIKWIDKKTKDQTKAGAKKSIRAPKHDDVIDFITLLKKSMKKKNTQKIKNTSGKSS